MANRDYRTVSPSAVYGEIDPVTGRPRSQTGASYTMPAPDFGQGYGASDDLLAGYDRRNEGAGGVGRGAMSGAATGAMVGSAVPGLGTLAGGVIGGIAGGIGGAFTKNAQTAMTDFSEQDARSALNKAYRQYLGRDASTGEIDTQLRNQGFRADQGHQWVGESGLRAVIDSIQNSPEAGRYTSTGLVNGGQAGAAGAGAATGFAQNPAASRPPVPGQPAPQPATGAGFTGGSGALVDPYTLPAEDQLLTLLANAQRYTGYDASTGRTGMAGAASGTGGYSFSGFDFAQDPANRDIGKSAKYAFSYFADEAAKRGDPMPRTKAEAEAWFTRNIAPGLQAAGYEIGWIKGDKARIKTREGWDEIDFLINADGDDPSLGWQSEVLAPGPQMSGGGVGMGGGSLPTSGMDLTSSALFDKLLAQAQAIASGQQAGASVLDNDALIRLLQGGR